jgi:single-strand DNA-binding protein
MASFNKVILIGNLTRDPEVRYTPKGAAVCDMSLAMNRKWTNDAGEKMEEVTFVDLVAWAKTAELAGKYLAKGSPIHVEGRLELQSWEDKATSQKRSKLRVVIESMQFLGARPEGQSGEKKTYPSPAQRPAPAPRPAPAQRPANDDFGDGPVADGMEDDDIPF